MEQNNNFKGRNLRAIVFFLLFIAGAYYYNINFQAAPCGRPIKYHLGTFDKDFGVSKESFLKAVATAEGLWEKEVGKELFEYTEKDGFIINLMYDNRQKITNRDAILKADIASNSNLADSVKRELTALKEQYDTASLEYESVAARFSSEQNVYQQRVRASNKKGGANESEYQELEAERNRLLSETDALERQRKEVNAIAEKRNELVKKYNLVAENINEKIGVVNQTAGEKFGVGEYILDDKGERINIFQFENRDKMIRVLAHELGHVLGVNHVPDNSSIMYELNEGTGESLGSGDIVALKELCGKELSQ